MTVLPGNDLLRTIAARLTTSAPPTSGIGTNRTSSSARSSVANRGKRTWRKQTNSAEIDLTQTSGGWMQADAVRAGQPFDRATIRF